MIKQVTDAIKRTTYALDYQTSLNQENPVNMLLLTMKVTIFDKDDITLPSWIEMYWHTS
jgi:hypothetical protein